jgi:hypothetical protein
MPSQIDILGEHPKNPNIFEKWFASTDIAPVPLRCHRSLTSKIASDDPELTTWLAQKIIDHHYSPSKLKRLKKKYKEIGFPKYAKQHRQIPNLLNAEG